MYCHPWAILAGFRLPLPISHSIGLHSPKTKGASSFRKISIFAVGEIPYLVSEDPAKYLMVSSEPLSSDSALEAGIAVKQPRLPDRRILQFCCQGGVIGFVEIHPVIQHAAMGSGHFRAGL